MNFTKLFKFAKVVNLGRFVKWIKMVVKVGEVSKLGNVGIVDYK